MINVEILTIGNEILLGVVEDTNSNYLCRVVRGMGGRVTHIAVVRDEADAIAREIRMSIERAADLIFTCGGLGPTDDDLTLLGIANAIGQRLEQNDFARMMVETRYRQLAAKGYVAKAEMSDSRLKMARLPEGARPIENPVGAAPAVIVETNATRIVSLPGVPGELKAIVEGSLQAFLREVFGCGSYREREVVVHCDDESELAPALRQVASKHPEVYLKSRASHFGANVTFRVLICASGATPEEANQLIEAANRDLVFALKDAGIEKGQ